MQANRLLRIVKPRVAEIAADAATQAVLSLAEKREISRRSVVRTPAGMIDETSPLCQAVKVGADGAKEIKMPDKLQALELDAKLAGEFMPRLDVSGTVLHVLTADERAHRLRAIMEQRAKARVIEARTARANAPRCPVVCAGARPRGRGRHEDFQSNGSKSLALRDSQGGQTRAKRLHHEQQFVIGDAPPPQFDLR